MCSAVNCKTETWPHDLCFWWHLSAWHIPLFNSVLRSVWPDCGRHIYQHVILFIWSWVVYWFIVSMSLLQMFRPWHWFPWLIVWGMGGDARYASPPSIKLSLPFCLSRWGQLLSTMAWTTVKSGRCKRTGPSHYCRQKNWGPFWTKLCSVHCPLL